ncbi:MAG: ornithine cyclodeaminase [Actinobacteria bacterium 13_2_20CM_2_66_6]|nr:MAG: ornithine cyclodeaminase [Actinobacteria bacterium 13_2_20CM_2_66_6]TME94702.1 MAG: ornithine cyclodeaminase family protein [Chloroflexota bacterium]
MKVLMLSQAEVTALLDLDRLLDALEEGFRAVSSGKVEVPGRTAVTTEHDGWLGTMPGYGAGLGLGVKLVSVFPHNDAAGLPSHQALIALFDPATGSPVAVMDGTRITAIRTAGAAAVSTRHLARKDSRVLAIIGAGVQGHAHLEIFPRVRDFQEIRIASRAIDSARKLAALNPKAHAVESFEEAARGADVIAMCTHSSTPVVRREWVGPGTHVTSVGYSAPHGELDRALADAANLFVESRAAAFSAPPAGCMELAGMDPEKASEMGEVLLGKRPGRGSDDEITVYKSMGHAVEDLAASGLVYREAKARGAGSSVEL